MPLGLLAVFALHPRIRGAAAIILATTGCIVLSAGMEAIQTYLPARVASNVDLTTNSVGGFLGACIGLAFAEPVLDRGRLLLLRRRWFIREASLGLVVTGLWFGAILYPEQFALGVGGFFRPFAATIFSWLSIAPWATPSAPQFALLEAIVCGAQLGTAGLLFQNLMRTSAPRMRLTLSFLGVTLMMKTLGTGMTYAMENPMVWLSVGAGAGVFGSCVFLGVAATASSRARTLAAILMLLLALVLVNLVPENPYFDAATGTWAYGRFLNFYGLTYGLSVAWPLIALVYLLRPRASHWSNR
jgi:hypothetical protein